MAGDITELLIAHRDGQKDALPRLFPLVYEDLRRIARAQLRGRDSATLESGVLVHEAYLKLVDQRRAGWNDRRHFFAVAAIAMRQIMVDYARHRTRQKRGGSGQPVTLDSNVADPAWKDLLQVIAVDQALARLEKVDPRLVRVVECRYFAGLSEQETAEALDLSLRTVQREWFKARAALREALATGTDQDDPR